jgi:membrane protein implicated in regulation of membrane protease activity
MKKLGWSRRSVVRYVLFQIPDTTLLILILIALRYWLDLPAWIMWGLIGVWVAKDILMFPFVWRAYDSTGLKGPHSVIGRRGVAEEQLAPTGYVRVHDELWKAEMIGVGQAIEKGQTVRIRGIRGLTLLVEHEDDGNLSDQVLNVGSIRTSRCPAKSGVPCVEERTHYGYF